MTVGILVEFLLILLSNETKKKELRSLHYSVLHWWSLNNIQLHWFNSTFINEWQYSGVNKVF